MTTEPGALVRAGTALGLSHSVCELGSGEPVQLDGHIRDRTVRIRQARCLTSSDRPAEYSTAIAVEVPGTPPGIALQRGVRQRWSAALRSAGAVGLDRYGVPGLEGWFIASTDAVGLAKWITTERVAALGLLLAIPGTISDRRVEVNRPMRITSARELERLVTLLVDVAVGLG